jgi:hypothetical protein
VDPVRPDPAGTPPQAQNKDTVVSEDVYLTYGHSTCPLCETYWPVTVYADCLLPACGCFGEDGSAMNPSRPCLSCGSKHARSCQMMPTRLVL